MAHAKAVAHEKLPDSHQDVYSKTLFGFWVYLLTDFTWFSTLFAAFVVLRNNTHGGPCGRELFVLSFTLVQTLVMVISCFTAGVAAVYVQRKRKMGTIVWFLITFLLGVVFVGMQGTEFHRLMVSGNGWDRNAFLSSFYTLVGTHGMHMLVGLLWILILLWPVFRKGITPVSIKRLTCLKMFWQFLGIVWIFIFTVVYLYTYLPMEMK